MTRRIDPSEWMWAQACDFIDQAERLHRQFFRLSASTHAQASWEPPIDVFEDERELVLVVALPGVSADRVEVMRESTALVVRAHRPLPFTGRRAVRQLEIPYGTFERRIPLPAAELDGVATELKHGCLVVRLRKVN
jgi:HSP20 family molecular chaperone IbpA